MEDYRQEYKFLAQNVRLRALGVFASGLSDLCKFWSGFAVSSVFTKPFKQCLKVFNIDVGSGVYWGHVPPKFRNEQRSALFIVRKCPFFFRKTCPRSRLIMPPKFEMLPTSLVCKKLYFISAAFIKNEGESLIYSSCTFLEISKKHNHKSQNHKEITCECHKSYEITEKLF